MHFRPNLYLLCLFICLGCHALAQSADELIGQWQDVKHPEKKVEIYRLPSGKYEGKALEKSTSQSDKPHILLRDLIWVPQEKKYKGRIAPPEGGGEINIDLLWVSPDEFTFSVSRFLMTRTFRFKRIK